MRLSLKTRTYVCFNPKLVRLEVRSIDQVCRHYVGFNPKLVRLEGFLNRRCIIRYHQSFNPKLVRLEAIFREWCQPLQREFQSQTGSIRRVTASTCSTQFLKCFNPKLVRLEGCDIRLKRRSRLEVSIPNWFD